MCSPPDGVRAVFIQAIVLLRGKIRCFGGEDSMIINKGWTIFSYDQPSKKYEMKFFQADGSLTDATVRTIHKMPLKSTCPGMRVIHVLTSEEMNRKGLNRDFQVTMAKAGTRFLK
jgi:hypothetical protein